MHWTHFEGFDFRYSEIISVSLSCVVQIEESCNTNKTATELSMQNEQNYNRSSFPCNADKTATEAFPNLGSEGFAVARLPPGPGSPNADRDGDHPPPVGGHQLRHLLGVPIPNVVTQEERYGELCGQGLEHLIDHYGFTGKRKRPTRPHCRSKKASPRNHITSRWKEQICFLRLQY